MPNTPRRVSNYADFEALPPDALLTPAEVAAAFKVDPKTVTRWSQAGRIPAIRTIGGHRRFRKADVVKAQQDAEREVLAGVEAATGIVRAGRVAR